MTFTDFSFTMTEVGNRLGPGSDQSNFDYGDNLDFKVAINFPVVPPADKFDLNLEVFTLEQSQGKRYVNIIQLADIKIPDFTIEIYDYMKPQKSQVLVGSLFAQHIKSLRELVSALILRCQKCQKRRTKHTPTL